MTVDKVKQIISAGLAFGALSIPGFAGALAAVGGDAEVMQAAVGAFAVYTLVHGIVGYVHGKAAALVLLMLLCPGAVLAQTPDPPPSRGGVLLAYATGHDAPDTGRWGVEADLRVGGTPLLIVGHVTDGSGGIGPKVQHNLGPIVLYGHTLFGTFETGADAMTDSQIRHGAASRYRSEMGRSFASASSTRPSVGRRT